MADLSITINNVKESSGATTVLGIAGSALIYSGKTVYYDASAGTWKLGNVGAAATAGVSGIAATTSCLDQPIVVFTSGNIAFGAILTVGQRYYASDTDGGIMPSTDLISTNYVTLLGVATSTSVMQLNILASGVTVP